MATTGGARTGPAPVSLRLPGIVLGVGRCCCERYPQSLLNTGSLAVLYCTPVYALAAAYPAGHWLLRAHFLAAGCLFAWVVAGPDPAPARPGVPARLVLLGAAIAGHAIRGGTGG
ncbi:cytochrome c oxidase assembly protein, partial [Streptomyces oryzae]